LLLAQSCMALLVFISILADTAWPPINSQANFSSNASAWERILATLSEPATGLTLLIALLCVPAVAVALLWNSTCGLQCIYCGDMLCFVGAGLNILTLAAQLLGQELLASHETAVLNSQIMILLGLCTVPVAWHAVRESGRLRDYLWEGMAITGPPLKVGPRLIPRQVQQFHPAVPLDRVSLCRAALATAQGKKPEK
ncbi:unnamed protein product, partial [Polarella glacialis]